jgi:hypothetical protein
MKPVINPPNPSESDIYGTHETLNNQEKTAHEPDMKNKDKIGTMGTAKKTHPAHNE